MRKEQSIVSEELEPRAKDAEEAVRIQLELRNRLVVRAGVGEVKRVAGTGVFYPASDQMIVAVVVLSFPDLTPVESVALRSAIEFPYIPGLLAFREGPGLLAAFRRLRQQPDLVIFHGHGIAHPRGMGLATHLGILLDLPSIGCADRLLYGRHEEPESEKGKWARIIGDSGEVIGAALRTRANTRPLLVSIGHRIDLPSAVQIVLDCCPTFRIPEPLRLARRLAREHPIYRGGRLMNGG